MFAVLLFFKVSLSLMHRYCLIPWQTRTHVHTCTHACALAQPEWVTTKLVKVSLLWSPPLCKCVLACVCPSQQWRTILNSFMFLFLASSLIFYFQLYKRSKESFVEGKTVWFSIIFYLILWPRTAAKIIAFKSALNKCNPSPAIIPQLQHQLFYPW